MKKSKKVDDDNLGCSILIIVVLIEIIAIIFIIDAFR